MQRVEKTIRVKAPVAQVYDYWRNFENFPQFMEHVEEVHCLDAMCHRSHWKIEGPMGKSVEYDAEMTRDDANRTIAWNSSDGEMGTTGQVTFTDLTDNTEVHVLMQWADPPGGAVGEAASHLFQNPEKMLEEDLQRFKDIVEGRVGSGLRR